MREPYEDKDKTKCTPTPHCRIVSMHTNKIKSEDALSAPLTFVRFSSHGSYPNNTQVRL